MSEKITFTFQVGKVKMEVTCSEMFADRQMERCERLCREFAELMGKNFQWPIQQQEVSDEDD